MLNKLKINRKLLRELDYMAILVVIVIVCFGALNIYATTRVLSGTHVLKAQLIWLVAGLVEMYLILTIDYKVIESYADVFYWGSVFLLVLNDFVFKSTVNGATSWMKIGGFQFQPSELMKIALCIMLAKKLDEMEGNINNMKNLAILCIYAAIPMALIVEQPDMGMTMVCFFMVLGMFFMSGLDLKIIGGGFAGVTALVAIIWHSPLMQPHWKARLIGFISPQSDELGMNFQVNESLKAIGSGGITGKGFLKGTQVAGGFIPENSTDFIFAAVGEEWGLIGAIFLLALYGILIYRFMKIAKSSKDRFGSLLTVGIISLFMFSILQNIGMTIGLAPITGITLQLMSYGGSSMLTGFLAISLVLNIGMRRKKINF